MARFHELWRETGGPGLPPCPDSGRVKARVNAALDASQTERRRYMKQKWRVALAAAAALAAITGTAFAAVANWDILAVWFQGDTTPGQAYVDSQARSVSDENYTLTVESSAADERSIYLTLRITALSDEAKAFIRTKEFDGIDTFYVRAVSDADGSEESSDAPASSVPDELPAMAISYSAGPLECTDEDSRRYALEVATLPVSNKTLQVRCGYMEEGKTVDVPITPAASLTVEVNATGEGVLFFTPAETVDSLELTIREISLSPFNCTVYGSSSSWEVYPNIRFRMKDGTVCTQSQILGSFNGFSSSSTDKREFNYRFQEVQDLDEIASVIVFDREYPLDGSKSVPVDHDPALDPFTVTRMEPLSEGGGYTVPVRELTEKLGGTYTWDAASQTAVCTYRGVTATLKAGETTALIDEREVELSNAPAEQGGVLTSDSGVFQEAWGITCYLQRVPKEENGQYDLVWHDWYIIP